MGAGLEGGLSLFTDGEENNRRYLILLSDGVDTKGEGYNDRLIETTNCRSKREKG